MKDSVDYTELNNFCNSKNKKKLHVYNISIKPCFNYEGQTIFSIGVFTIGLLMYGFPV